MAKDSHNSGDPPPPRRPHQRGQTKQPPTRSLLEWLWREEALTYLNDQTTPFDNNQCGHDLRMLRAQQ